MRAMDKTDRLRRGRIAPWAVFAAALALLVGACSSSGSDAEESEETTTTEESATTEAPSTTDAPSTTQAPPVTVPTVRSSPDARAVGTLVGCRRSGSGVVATVDVRHTSGGAGRFLVEIGVVDASGRSIATGRATSGLIADGQVVPVQVEVAAEGIVNGACELVSVDPV